MSDLFEADYLKYEMGKMVSRLVSYAKVVAELRKTVDYWQNQYLDDQRKIRELKDIQFGYYERGYNDATKDLLSVRH